jgi:hypothetical protein
MGLNVLLDSGVTVIAFRLCAQQKHIELVMVNRVSVGILTTRRYLRCCVIC